MGKKHRLKTAYSVKISCLPFVCSSCGANAGYPCTDRKGSERPRPHNNRTLGAVMLAAKRPGFLKHLARTRAGPESSEINRFRQQMDGANGDQVLGMRKRLVQFQVDTPSRAFEIGVLIRDLNEQIRHAYLREKSLVLSLFRRSAKEMLPDSVYVEIARAAEGKARRAVGFSDAAGEKRAIAFDPASLIEEYGQKRVMDAYSLACQQGTRPETAFEMREILGPVAHPRTSSSSFQPSTSANPRVSPS